MSTEQVEICALAGGSRHPATDKGGKPTGHRLCQGHFSRLAEMLREIEKEYDDVVGDPSDPDSYGAVPSIAIQWNTGGGGHSGGGAPAFEQAPARLDALVLTDHRQGLGDRENGDERKVGNRTNSVLALLVSYAARVRTERGLTPPERRLTDCVDRIPGATWHGPFYGLPCRHPVCSGVTVERVVPGQLTVATERQVLTRHVDLIAKWPDVEAVFIKLRRLLGQLRQVNDSAQHPLGKCPVDQGVRACGGPLWPAKPIHTVGEWKGSTPSAVACEHCDTRWEGPGELARLALILEQQRKAS